MFHLKDLAFSCAVGKPLAADGTNICRRAVRSGTDGREALPAGRQESVYEHQKTDPSRMLRSGQALQFVVHHFVLRQIIVLDDSE